MNFEDNYNPNENYDIKPKLNYDKLVEDAENSLYNSIRPYGKMLVNGLRLFVVSVILIVIFFCFFDMEAYRNSIYKKDIVAYEGSWLFFALLAVGVISLVVSVILLIHSIRKISFHKRIYELAIGGINKKLEEQDDFSKIPTYYNSKYNSLFKLLKFTVERTLDIRKGRGIYGRK